MKQLNQDIDQRKQTLLLCEQGKFTQAREILVELEHAQGLNADACSLMGSILGQLREYEEAVGYFQRAIDSAPDKPQAYTGQARALISLGRVAEAESRYERLIERQPGSAQVIVQLATMLLGRDATMLLKNAIFKRWGWMPDPRKRFPVWEDYIRRRISQSLQRTITIN